MLSHAFLLAMEQHGCLGEGSGWIPRYLTVTEDGRLLAAMPLFEKHNSWGEFVFDHAWADAYARYGLDYYPKLVASIPFSPVFAQKFLCRQQDAKRVYPLLLGAARELAARLDCSSLHILFPLHREQGFCEQEGLLVRHDCQYHWHNRNYPDFAAFLDRLTHKKRKNIRQERRKVKQAGITFRVLDGTCASDTDWDNFTRFYTSTYDRKWGAPIFNQGFFQAVAKALAKRLVLVLADRAGRCIAGALMYRSARVLYGRHWGCEEYHDALHFETCYYQGIEYCIAQGIDLFEPGAQGPHKLARGFEPTLTSSAHWVADSRFQPAIGRFCEEESRAVREHIAAMQRHGAYREEQ